MMQVTLDSKRLDICFAISLILLIVTPILLPQLRISFFVPFLIIACYQKPLKVCLGLAFGCGLLLDLLSSYTRLGLHAFDFCTTLILLFPQRRNFFADHLSTLPIMTFLFSMLSTLIMAILLYSIETRNLFSWAWVFTDLILMPLLDAAYAFCFFILPPLLLGKPRKRGKDYFLSR